MGIAISILLILHFIGLAGIIGGWIATVKAPVVNKAILHGSILQVVTGILLVGLREMEGDGEMNHMKIGIKLVIALVILVLAVVGTRKEAKVPGSSGTLAVAAGVLAIVNVAIAVLV